MGAVVRHERPEPGVTEIRVHGVGGTPPEALLGQTGVTQVTGDEHAGMFRGAIEYPNRTIEAYSWGGLTARSRSRAFWILLLPFSLVNIAGWMIEPARRYTDDREDYDALTWQRTRGIKWHESWVHLIAIASTSMYVMWVALISMNILAFQCGGIEGCYTNRWYLKYFGESWFRNHPGRRVVFGLVAPLALLGLFWVLGHISRKRYDKYGVWDELDEGEPPQHPSRSVLGLRSFWFTELWQRPLSHLHFAVAFLLLGGLLARVAHEFDKEIAVDVVPDIGMAVFLVAVALGVTGGLVLFVATFKSRLLPGHGVGWFKWWATGILGASLTVFAIGVWLAWQLDDPNEELLGYSKEGLSQMTSDLWGFGWAPIQLLVLAVVGVVAFSVIQLWRWLVWRQVELDQLVIPLMLLIVVLWDRVWIVALAVPPLLGLAWLARWGAGHVEVWIAGRVLAESSEPAAGTEPIEGPEQRADWGTGPPPVHGLRVAAWKAGVFYGVALIATLVWAVTKDAGGGYGSNWPRYTPMLTFVVILVLLNVLETTLGKRTPWRRPGKRPGRKPKPVPIALTAIPVGVIVLGYSLDAWLNRSEWSYGAVGLAWVILAIAWLAQFRFDGWRWNGPAAVAVIGLAVLMGAASGGVIRLADLLDLDGSEFRLRATPIYEWLAVGLVAFFIAGIIGFAVWYLLVRLGIAPKRPDGTIVEKGEALPEAIRAVDVTVTVVTLLMAAGGLSLVLYLNELPDIGIQDWIDQGTPTDWAGIVTLSSWATVGIVIGAFIAVRQGLKDHGFRTRLGILWDVASFWPRSFHPFAPPAYAARAVPELSDRITEIAVNAKSPPGTDPNRDRSCGSSILSGHSQGSVISVATVAQLDEAVQRRTWLVTHGSPLVRFYRTYFPRYFTDSLLKYCAIQSGKGGATADGGWINFWRRTDPIGDPVFRRINRKTPPSGTPANAVAAALSQSPESTDHLPDVRLLDPNPSDVRSPFQEPPEARGHSDYLADRAMWDALDARTELSNAAGTGCNAELERIYEERKQAPRGESA